MRVNVIKLLNYGSHFVYALSDYMTLHIYWRAYNNRPIEPDKIGESEARRTNNRDWALSRKDHPWSSPIQRHVASSKTAFNPNTIKKVNKKTLEEKWSEMLEGLKLEGDFNWTKWLMSGGTDELIENVVEINGARRN